MESAKAAVNKIVGRTGHDTSVDEVVNPAVTQETVKPQRHEETTTAIDKEVHQDHYHTTVQPLQHQETLPEKHTHQVAPAQEREFHHGDREAIQQSVGQEAAAFKDSSVTAPTTHTQAQAPAAMGEHVHHHVHETVQPVVHKETIAPSVVHTTIPVHERHQAPSEHHGMSVLPSKTLGDFTGSGGSLESSHRQEHYEGDPRHYNPQMQVERHDIDKNPEAHDGLHSGSQTGTHTGSGVASGAGTGLAAATASSGLSSHQTGTGTTGTTGTTGLTGSSGVTGTTGTSTSRGIDGVDATSGYGSGHTGTSTSRGIEGVDASSGYGSGHTGATGAGANTGLSEGSSMTGTALGGRTEGNTAGRAVDVAEHSSRGPTEGHNTTTSGPTGSSTTGSSTVGNVASSTTHQHGDGHHREGHGTTNQQHHGSTLDNVARDDGQQHASQGRDPAMVEDKSDKKLTGSGVDGSHSAVFGLTPDGHKHDDTAHGSTKVQPAHSKESNDTEGSRQDKLAEQLTDPRVAEKGHGGAAVSDTGSGKPGAGAPGLSQGLGEVRPQDHGAESKLKDKIDPTTDADGDGKRGVMD